MGRITIFTCDGSADCARVKSLFDKLALPYVEINVTHQPDRLADMRALSDRLVPPHVYFNTRFIGGAPETISLLQEWQNPKHKKRYATLYDRYQAEIGSFPDPVNPRLHVSDASPRVYEDVVGILTHTAHLDRVPHPNGTTVPYLQLLEELQRVLPRGNNIYRLQTYTLCFTAQQAVKALMVEYDLTQEEAYQWGRTWQDAHVLDHVTSEHAFDEVGTYFFRLQCDRHVDILNDYRQWSLPTATTTTTDPTALVERLHHLMQQLLQRVRNDNGEIDYIAAATTQEYPLMQYCICELQCVDLSHMEESVQLAFGINVCNLLLRFAYIRHGFATSDASCLEYLSLVKFNIGGHVYSFTEWRNGFLRNNRKQSCGAVVFSPDDPRSRISVRRLDPRMHFALEWGMPSCSPIPLYRAESLNEELTIAAMAFCERHVCINEKKGTIQVSKVFQWYKCDFVSSSNNNNSHEDLSTFLMPYLRRIQQQELTQVVRNHKSHVKYVYMDYSWNAQASRIQSFTPSHLSSVKVKVRDGIKHGLKKTFPTVNDYLHVRVP
jgi:glutaredoxin